MVFSTSLFLFIFLPIVLFCYYISPKRTRNFVLFIASLVFYAWGEPKYIGIMLFSTVFDYCNGLLIDRFKNQRKKAKLVLINAVVVNLSILAFFKYSNFFITNINHFFGMNLSHLNLSLPIGISFYTFQTMSYSIDVYRGEATATKNIIDFGAYVTLFPQLIAGPIVRYQDIQTQLKGRKESYDSFAYGVQRFTIGLFKKIILANNIGLVFESIAAMKTIPMSAAWLGAIAFSFQIYFDFSGYSDMAIGLGSMFGFRFLENFDHPYISKSITEFWRRWHISLGVWFREYVYIPLGGNKKGRFELVRNLLIVWILTGFWHGASWNFILWGLYFGIIIILEKLFILKWLKRIPSLFAHLYGIVLIVFGWVIFAFEDLSKIAYYLSSMMGRNGFFSSDAAYLLRSNAVLILLCIILSTDIIEKIKHKAILSRYKNLWFFSENTIYTVCFLVSVLFLVGASYNPFLYFRF